MNMTEHIVELRGEASFGLEIRPEAAGSALLLIPKMVRDSLRMGVLRSSRRLGRPMSELSRAWDIRYSGQSAGDDRSTQLHFVAPRLRDAAPRLFDQEQLFVDVIDPDDTGFDLAAKMLADVACRREDSLRFDAPLLRRIANFDRVFRYGIDTIHLVADKLDELKRTDIDANLTAIATKLVADTPEPCRVRIAGVLDMIRISDRLFELLLPGDQRVRAVWTASSVVQLRSFLSKDVVIEGTAVYRPSGALLRIDAEVIVPARAADRFFAKVPKPSSQSLQVKSLRRPQNKSNGVNAIWGAWQGNETDEDLLAALEEIR